MTNKYLEKIAAKKEDKKFRPGQAFGAAIAGSIAATPAALGAQRAGIALGNSLNNHISSGSSLSTVKKYMKDKGMHKDVTFNHREHVLKSKGYSPKERLTASFLHNTKTPAYYGDNTAKRSLISGVKNGKKAINPDVIMHELGHAEDFRRHAKLKKGMSVLGRSNYAQGVAGIAALGTLSHDSTREYATPIAAIPHALIMREELAANHNAYKAIKKHEGHIAANKFLRGTALKNTANYGLNAVGAVGSTYVAKKILDRVSPVKKKEK